MTIKSLVIVVKHEKARVVIAKKIVTLFSQYRKLKYTSLFVSTKWLLRNSAQGGGDNLVTQEFNDVGSNLGFGRIFFGRDSLLI